MLDINLPNFITVLIMVLVVIAVVRASSKALNKTSPV